MSKYKRGENVNPIDAKRKLEAQYKRQNEYNSKNYERVSLMLPFGEREKVRSAACCLVIDLSMKRLITVNVFSCF